MSTIRAITKSIGTTPEAGAGAGFQFWNGAGILEALVVNFSATADANTVLTAYDGKGRRPTTSGADVLPNAADRVSIYTQTGNTDLGTTVPVFIAGDADLVAGTATAGVGGGVLFTEGLFFNVTSDVAGPQVVTAFIRPLIAKTKRLWIPSGTTLAENIWDGPAKWIGYSLKLTSSATATLDITFKDSPIAAAGNTVMTKTDYAVTPGTKVNRKVVTTVGEDEAGAVVTTAATGTYGVGGGIWLTTGLNVNLAQGTAGNLEGRMICVFDA